MASNTILNKLEVPGRCGILTCRLIDPLSQLLSKILATQEDNCVGFYYFDSKLQTWQIFLYDVHDNNPIAWLRLGTTLDLLVSSGFVTRLTFYALLDTTDKGKLEETFRITLVDILSANSKMLQAKNLTYTYLLLKSLGLANINSEPARSGFTLVNEVLCKLMKITVKSLSSAIMACPILASGTTFNNGASFMAADQAEIDQNVQKTRQDLTLLAAVFIDLFINHETFRVNILSSAFHKRENNLIGIFAKETALVLTVVNALHTGHVTNQAINTAINDLNKERFNIGYYQRLIASTMPTETLTITKDNTPISFHQPILANNIEPLRDLGTYISHLAETFTDNKPFTVNIGTLIAMYNDIVRGTGIEPISMSFIGGNHTISRTAIATIPGHKSSLVVEGDYTAIPMYNPNLSILSDSHLVDMLVLIDSLRANETSNNTASSTRFVNLVNEISRELATRRRTRLNDNIEINISKSDR